jgi:hypothetical protein
MKIEDFILPIEIKGEFTQDNVLFLAHQVAEVHEGKFKGTEVLAGFGGPVVRVVRNGESLGCIGFTYTALVNAALDPFMRRYEVHIKNDRI